MKQNWIEDNIIILSKQTIDKMLESQYPSNLIGLYCFYYYTAKWQKTNMIKCTTNYVMKGLNWTKEKVINTKKELKKNGLIEDRQTKNKKGQITGWYIKVNYIWKKETIKNQKVELPEGGKSHRVENPDTNALSANSLNALSANNKTATPAVVARKDQVIFDLIELFKPINPTYERLFSNKTQRASLDRLVKKFGREKIENMIKYLPKIFGKPYAPVITTPFELEKKLANLISYIQQEKSKGPKVFKLR